MNALLTVTAFALANPYPVAAPAAVVPVYSAAYGQQLQLDDLIAAINKNTAAIEKLTAIVQAGATPNGPPQTPPAIDALAIAKANCLKCHSPSTAATGFDFRLFADDEGAAFAPLNNRDRLRVANRITDGSMPPPKVKSAMTADDRRALAEHFRK